ncbi:MAG TPA: tripartite tricarboxylate transporter substrate binding protein, partial [Burkholderiales bacterium]|nr:tripartite tricarboxylate transporter substrate binding protein [Burkholderiales bacterium]
MKTHAPVSFTLFTIGTLFCTDGAAQQQPYPTKPIRLIVPYPAGGSADLIGRAVNEMLARRLGQPVIVDNRGGASSIIGAEIAARAPADGYTMLVATITTLAVNPALYRKLPYHPERDFAPVTMLGSTPYLLAVHPTVPARSVAQLVAHAKANPGKLNFGSAGIGSGNHLATEMFKHMAVIDIVHVPYKGVGAATIDVVGGQIALLLGGVSVLKTHADGGRLRALAVSTAKRSAIAPDIPTIDESGVKGYQTNSWNSLVVPRRTPAAIVQRLNTEINAVLNTPQLADLLKS